MNNFNVILLIIQQLLMISRFPPLDCGSVFNINFKTYILIFCLLWQSKLFLSPFLLLWWLLKKTDFFFNLILSFQFFQSIMGVFFYTNSVAFIEDVKLESESYESEDELTNDIEAGFQQVQWMKQHSSRSCFCLKI